MEVVIMVVFSLYLALVFLLIAGWEKAMTSRASDRSDESKSRISVIVAVRNEEHNILALVRSFRAQDHPNVEMIIVDDHSTDGTGKVLENIAHANIRVASNTGHGKKSAIATGIYYAHGEVIATTDADCILPSTWLKAINAVFMNPETKLSFGGVRIDSDGSFFSKLQSIEFASLIGSGAAMAALGFPMMCNGANLAYRKNTFTEVNGFDGNLDVASGDDEFLMRKVLQKYSDGVTFDNAKARIVTTAPAADIHAFLQQRIRWASKWKHNTSFSAAFMALFIILAQVATIGMWIFAILDQKILIISGIFVKLIIEAFLLYRVCTFLNVRWSTLSFLTLQIIYPVYVLAIGIASNFLSFRWKGREKGLAQPSEHV